MKKMKIDGFCMHQAILKEFHMIRDQSFERPPASAYVVYLTMLNQLDQEKNQRGILKEYNLSYWARKLSIPYSSFYSGKQYLEKYSFIKEEIHNGLPVLVLKDIEKLNNPALVGGTMNYLVIPHALFETNILAEMVRTSNPEGIELLFSLLNQFRTALSKNDSNEIKKCRQSRTMATLKKQLNKNAKKVREILTILEPLFDIEFEGVQYRGEQMWVRKVWITLKEECMIEESDDMKGDQLIAKLAHELTYFLSGIQIRYKARDQRDIIHSFKQEVYNKLKMIKEGEEFSLEKAAKRYFLQCMDQIGNYIETERKRCTSFSIHSLGALFRKTFRNQLAGFLSKVPYELIFEGKLEEHKKTGTLPDLAV